MTKVQHMPSPSFHRISVTAKPDDMDWAVAVELVVHPEGFAAGGTDLDLAFFGGFREGGEFAVGLVLGVVF